MELAEGEPEAHAAVIKRLKKHYEAYEPTILDLRKRYETAMKEKMLIRLERDRFSARVTALDAGHCASRRRPPRRGGVADGTPQAPARSSSSSPLPPAPRRRRSRMSS